jgi:phage gpG-like protein
MAAPKASVTLLRDWILEIKDGFQRANALAGVEMAQQAEKHAKQNITQQFTGRRGYRLTGRLLNSVFWAIEKGKQKGMPRMVIGTRGIPYGAIHEFGGTIDRKNWKYLWVKNWEAPRRFKRLTPKEFYDKQKRNPNIFEYRGRTAGMVGAGAKVRARKSALKGVKTSGTNADFTVLFFLVKSVTIPKRPYLQPAIREASKVYGPALVKHLNKITGEPS